MDNREALFGGGNRRPLPGRQVQGGGPRPGGPGGYSSLPPRPSQSDPRQAPPDTSRYYDSPPPNANGRDYYRQEPAPAPTGYGGRAPAGKLTLHVEKNKDQDSNVCYVSEQDFPGNRGALFYILLGLQGGVVVTAQAAPDVPPGEVRMNKAQRTWCQVSDRPMRPEDYFSAQVYDGPKSPLASLDVELEFAAKPMGAPVPLDQDDLENVFLTRFNQQILCPGQQGMLSYSSYYFKYKVKTVQVLDPRMEKSRDATSNPSERGLVSSQESTKTLLNIFPVPPVKLKGSRKRPAANAILRPDFKFADMGIGGLDEEFSTIFRRAFASRVFPPGLVAEMGISHVKGILLYGPPGTGKTLIARQIGKMLNAREPKIINGPEILNKYVGASEENVRKMFADAEKEYKEAGEDSGLHIIIFDELDAVCKQRGSTGGGTGVGDSVVNQLLTKLDGVEALNNILLIGMTNRKDLIDDALLRPGRLEVHMEISLPDENGRLQILGIHTAKIRKAKRLSDDIDLNELARVTKNYSGAELNGLVKAALSYAFTRHTKLGDVTGVMGDPEDVMLTRDDLMRALEDVKPAFGVSEEELESSQPYGIVHYSPHIESILSNGLSFVEQVRIPQNAPLFSVLVHGPRGAGKTALAAEIGLKSEFPFVKLVRPIDVGTNESSKLDYLRRVFADAHKSPLSIVILDRIEALIDWNPIGLRFSNAVVQYISAILQTTPPKGRRLLIMATTSQRSMLDQHGALEFDREIAVPAVKDLRELQALLSATGKFDNPADINGVISELRSITGSENVGIGVKAIFSAIETALVRRDQPLASTLAAEISEIIATRNPDGL
ncbi:hypothetical protein MGN70_000535 [Eutypa lata]|uniref:Vesicular-fusion protein SEC18 n=1 Tax=Eutypa lata (strain UCR-EL1) TaxID=1287681 RepID=M7SXH3_EUTLA|nr:putative vesicle-fusing atpase protein [Eutypa lata UCREL1]KAI1257493.1 hypothetical protein MGN70_000535 [Eutypa lata]